MSEKPIYSCGAPHPKVVYALEGQIEALTARAEAAEAENERLVKELEAANAVLKANGKTIADQGRENERLRAKFRDILSKGDVVGIKKVQFIEYVLDIAREEAEQ